MHFIYLIKLGTRETQNQPVVGDSRQQHPDLHPFSHYLLVLVGHDNKTRKISKFDLLVALCITVIKHQTTRIFLPLFLTRREKKNEHKKVKTDDY